MTRKEVFTKNLRKLIENSGKSQVEIADAIREKYTTFNMWVAYNGTMPRADKLQKIADYFGVGLDELMNEDHDIHIKSDLDVTIDALKDLNPLQLMMVRSYIQYLKFDNVLWRDKPESSLDELLKAENDTDTTPVKEHTL